MILYIPAYDRKWKIVEIESKEAVFRKRAGFDATITIHGTIIYNGELLFSAPEGAKAYCNKDCKYKKALLNANDVEWKQKYIIA